MKKEENGGYRESLRDGDAWNKTKLRLRKTGNSAAKSVRALGFVKRGSN